MPQSMASVIKIFSLIFNDIDGFIGAFFKNIFRDNFYDQHNEKPNTLHINS